MKRYIVGFFTFLGYLTFFSLIGAAIVVFIGYRKSQAHEASIMQSKKEVPMTPVRETDSPTAVREFPDLERVSPTPLAAERTTRVADNKPAVRPAKKPATPKVSAWKKTPEAPVTYKKSEPVAKAIPKAKPARATKKAKPVFVQQRPEEMPPSRLQWRVTDNANPRTGKGIFTRANMNEMSELEREAKRRVELEQIRKAAETIRNPPVWESGIVRIFQK